MNRIDIIIQKSGGCGKTLIAGLIAQHSKNTDKGLILIDTTGKDLLSLNIEADAHIQVNLDTNPSEFQKIIDTVLQYDDSYIIIDCSTQSLNNLLTSIVDSDFNINMLHYGHLLHFHWPLVGGGKFDNSIKSFKEIYDKLTHAQFIIWNNPFFGKVENQLGSFEYQDIDQEDIFAIASLPDLTSNAPFNFNFKQMLEKNLTFKEALSSNAFDFLAKARLKKIQDQIAQQMHIAKI